MYTVNFCTLGCKVNQYESEAMAQLFMAEGFAVNHDQPAAQPQPDKTELAASKAVNFSTSTKYEGLSLGDHPTKQPLLDESGLALGANRGLAGNLGSGSTCNIADIFVVNSCTVTSEGDRKTRQMVRRLRRENPSSVIALTGCYPQAFPAEMQSLAEADVITGSKDRAGLVRAVKQFLADGERVVAIRPHQKGDDFEQMQTSNFGKRTRAFVKIQDGCERYCSYCIIPFARGRLRSKPLSQLNDELTTLAANGYKEVVLVGINLCCYGKDFATDTTLIDAVKAACFVDGIERVRLGSIEPQTITPDDIKALALLPKFCPQFHLSLQSGSDATLLAMNRQYTTAQYMAVVAQIRQSFAQPAITTDMMVGFPQESDTHHAESLAFARAVGFAKIHTFAYSVREGTKAAKMSGQICKADKKQRNQQLMAVEKELRHTFLQSLVGSKQQILVEEMQPDGSQVGYTPNYTPVTISSEQNLRGQIVDVLITAADDDGCIAVLQQGGNV